MKVDVEEKLKAARYDTVVIYGIGGHVKVRDYARVYDEIDAELFAKITFATHQMVVDCDPTDWGNPEKIPPTIDKYNFEQNQLFSDIKGVFLKHLGLGKVQL